MDLTEEQLNQIVKLVISQLDLNVSVTREDGNWIKVEVEILDKNGQTVISSHGSTWLD